MLFMAPPIESTMKLKKLRGQHTIEVDAQIVRWRERMKKEGVLLGRAMRKAEEKNRRQNLAKTMDTDDKLKKKNWFG